VKIDLPGINEPKSIEVNININMILYNMILYKIKCNIAFFGGDFSYYQPDS
jgi:hypothetical protein